MRRAWLVLILLAGCTSEEQPHVRWRGFEGSRAYVFSSSEQTPSGGGTLEVEVVVRSARGEPDRIEIRHARAGSTPATLSDIALDPACAREFGGDVAVLGRVIIREGIDPHASVPSCVPENLFGAVTDLIAILLVQSPRFSIDSLRAAGDSARFTGFEAHWSRPDPEMRASVVAGGGTTRLVRLSTDEAVVHWRPDPMQVTIVRRVAPGRVLVMRGQEHFALELRLNTRQGAIRSAHAVEDWLDMRAWLLESDTLPGEMAALPGDGQPLVIRRTIEFVPASDAPSDGASPPF